MHGDAGELSVDELALTGVKAASDVDSKGLDLRGEGRRTTNTVGCWSNVAKNPSPAESSSRP